MLRLHKLTWQLFAININLGFEQRTYLSQSFHKQIVTVLKIKHEKARPKIIKYRDCKNFGSARFFDKVQVRLTNPDRVSLDFGSLKKCFMELLNKVAPLKTKFLRADHSIFAIKEVSKAIILRNKLRNQDQRILEDFRGKN